MTETRRRSRTTFANVTSVLALVAALGGTAHAAGLIDGGDVKNGSLTGKDVRNGSLRGVDLKDGSVTETDLAPGTVTAPGAELRPGVLLRGVFAPNSASPTSGNSAAGQGVSFSNPLGARPRAHVMGPDAEPTAACPGTLADPLAAAGHLCVYVRFAYPSATQVVVTDTESQLEGINYNLQSGAETVFGDGMVSRFGFRIAVISTSNVAQLEGTWAVRAG